MLSGAGLSGAGLAGAGAGLSVGGFSEGEVTALDSFPVASPQVALQLPHHRVERVADGNVQVLV